MAAHPNLPISDARQIISWVLSLADDSKKSKSLPATGTLDPTLNKKPTDNGMLVISASYTDKGGAGIKPLMGNTSVALRNSKLSVTAANNLAGFTIMSFSGMQLMIVPKVKASFSLDNIDLTGITSVDLIAAGDKPPEYGYTFELHLDSHGWEKDWGSRCESRN